MNTHSENAITLDPHTLLALSQADSLSDFSKPLQQAFAQVDGFHSLRVSMSPLDALIPKLEADPLLSSRPASYRKQRNRVDPTPTFLESHRGLPLASWDLLRSSCEKAHDFQQRYMKPEGWSDYFELYFWEGTRFVGYLCVRFAGSPQFELSKLENIRKKIEPFFNHLRGRIRLSAEARFYRSLVARMPIALVVLDPELKVFYANGDGSFLCQSWRLGARAARSTKAERRPKIPQDILQRCEQLKREKESYGTLHSPEHSIRASIQRVDINPELNSSRFFLIWLSQDSHDRAAPSLAALSPSERSAAKLAAAGLSNPQIASQLGKSPSTIRAQLHSAFRKLNIEKRVQLAKLLRDQ